VQVIVAALTPNFEQCRDWLDRYASFDNTGTNEELFRLLDDGAHLPFNLKEYKQLDYFCQSLKQSIALEDENTIQQKGSPQKTINPEDLNNSN
jgi:hypothetical protein